MCMFVNCEGIWGRISFFEVLGGFRGGEKSSSFLIRWGVEMRWRSWSFFFWLLDCSGRGWEFRGFFIVRVVFRGIVIYLVCV